MSFCPLVKNHPAKNKTYTQPAPLRSRLSFNFPELSRDHRERSFQLILNLRGLNIIHQRKLALQILIPLCLNQVLLRRLAIP